MLNSGILDVVIGLTVIYLQLSLVCTAINELVAALLRKRANDLELGIRMLLNDAKKKKGFRDKFAWIDSLSRRFRSGEEAAKKVESLTSNFYDHPLIRALKPNGKTPSYIPARTFALTLIDLIRNPPPAAGNKDASAGSGATGGGTPAPPPPANPTPPPGGSTSPPTPAQLALQDLLNKVRAGAAQGEGLVSPDLMKAVRVLIEDAGNDMNKARANIETWFNDSMDRVSGWYKRKSQFFIFLIAAFTTIFANVDTIRIADSLATNKSLRDSLVAAAPALAAKAPAATTTPTPAATPTPATTPTPEGSAPPAGGGGAGGDKPPAGTAPAGAGDDKSLGDRVDDIGAALKKLQKYDLPIGWVEPCASPTPTPTPGASPTPKPTPSPAGCKENFSKEDLPRRYPTQWLSVNPAETYSTSVWDQFRLHWLGWLLTAMAISLGAPFWFDILNRLMVIRSTVKPHEKSPEQGSKDETVGDDEVARRK
jgi:hypothetical protein